MVFYKGLDPDTISLVLLRKFLRYTVDKNIKRVGNSMLERFEKLLSDYTLAKIEYFKEGSKDFNKIDTCISSEISIEDLNADEDFFDDTIPAMLQRTMVILFSALKQPFFRHKISSKKGHIWEQCYKLYHEPLEVLDRQIYPSFLHVSNISNQGPREQQLPSFNICSLEDVEAGIYLADFGRKVVFIEFISTFDDEIEGQQDEFNVEPKSDTNQQKQDQNSDGEIEEEEEQEKISSQILNLSYKLLNFDDLKDEYKAAVTTYLNLEYGYNHNQQYKYNKYFYKPRIYKPLTQE